MSTIRKFIQEASLRGNKATPDSYLDSVNQRAQGDIRATEQRLGQRMAQFTRMVGEVHHMQAEGGKQAVAGLEALAKKTILDTYGSILGDTVLNIKMPERDEVKNMMEDVPSEPPAQQALKALEDKRVISEVEKRKIANNITQGEAKNVKRMFLMPEVREGLVAIFGEEKGLRYLELIKNITDIASAMDWRIPMEVQHEMWERDKSRFAGSVEVTWEKPADEDLAKKILKDIENGEDITNSPDAEEALGEMQPTINALGSDFAMLLHEAVKGIYELIASAGIPEDEGTAETVIGNTDTLKDELEDLRYGPYLAADLRDFINSIPEASAVENVREHVFGRLMQMPADEFLEIMKAIFTNDESAKLQVRAMILDIKNELQDWEYQNAMDRYSDEPAAPAPVANDEPEEEDYSEMTQREIEALIDDALDAGDIAKVSMLAKYLKK